LNHPPAISKQYRQLWQNTTNMYLSMFFKSRQDNEYNEFNINLEHVGIIPNFTHIRYIHIKRANEWFMGS
jgi:hypothetical protein